MVGAGHRHVTPGEHRITTTFGIVGGVRHVKNLIVACKVNFSCWAIAIKFSFELTYCKEGLFWVSWV
jgi:hypothetical protein